MQEKLEKIYFNVKCRKLFQQNTFLTCSWRFLRLIRLEQLEYKLEKNIGI